MYLGLTVLRGEFQPILLMYRTASAVRASTVLSTYCIVTRELSSHNQDTVPTGDIMALSFQRTYLGYECSPIEIVNVGLVA